VRYIRDVGPGDVGVRATVRHRLADGQLTDVVGVVERWSDGVVLVRDRRERLHTVAEADVVAARRVPPPPERR
jgi:hypothetical protein